MRAVCVDPPPVAVSHRQHSTHATATVAHIDVRTFLLLAVATTPLLLRLSEAGLKATEGNQPASGVRACRRNRRAPRRRSSQPPIVPRRPGVPGMPGGLVVVREGAVGAGQGRCVPGSSRPCGGIGGGRDLCRNFGFDIVSPVIVRPGFPAFRIFGVLAVSTLFRQPVRARAFAGAAGRPAAAMRVCRWLAIRGWGSGRGCWQGLCQSQVVPAVRERPSQVVPAERVAETGEIVVFVISSSLFLRAFQFVLAQSTVRHRKPSNQTNRRQQAARP